MGARAELLGETFGRLTVVEPHGDIARADGRSCTTWLCQCECGVALVVKTESLRSGNTKSCGCLRADAASVNGRRNRRHGHRLGPGNAVPTSPEYRSWSSMVTRCENPRFKDFRHYGGRGISICARWRESFQTFLADMGPRPRGRSLDRIDVDGNYEPGNCRWATAKQQRQNQRPPASRRASKEADLVVHV